MTAPLIDTDLDEPMDGGIYGLWLHVLYMSVLEIQDGRFPTHRAEEFLFDPENIFFDFVCDRLGFDPAGMRERIKIDYRDRIKNNMGQRASCRVHADFSFSGEGGGSRPKRESLILGQI